MATQTWHYLENQFDNATETSNKLMNIINADHYAKLQAQAADPDIAALVARTTAPHDAFIAAYTDWLTAKGIYKGETSRLDNYVEDLRKIKIKQWDIQIQQVFIEGTPDYVAILPNGRKPFQSGGIDQRIAQVQALANRLSTYPGLAITRTDVLAFLATFTAERDIQQQKEELVANASDILETARKAIALMMYKNLGRLMNKYAANTDYISNFWELSLLRTITPQDDVVSDPIDGSVNAGATVNVPVGVFDNTNHFILRNTGITDLLFCLKDNAVDACTAGVTVLPGEDATVTLADLGAIGSAFLNVTNLNATNIGNFQVIVVG